MYYNNMVYQDTYPILGVGILIIGIIIGTYFEAR